MAKDGENGGSFSDLIKPARDLVAQNKAIFIDKHEYRPATEKDFADRDRAWYDSAAAELESLGFKRLGDVVNATVEKAGVRAIIRRMISKDGTTMAALFQFVGPGKNGMNLRVCDLESELNDASFVTTSNSEASKGVSLPQQIVSAKHPAATTPKELFKLHAVAQKTALKKNKELDFVEIRSAEDYQASQHRQEAIKAAFRKGIKYLDPAEVRRIAEARDPNDPTTATIAEATANIARHPPTALEAMMNASDEGAGPAAMGKIFVEQMMGKIDAPADKKEDIANTINQLFSSIGGDEKDAGMKGLFSLMGKLQDLEPKEEKEARQKQRLADMERMAKQQEEREKSRKAERVAKGLSETTGTGKPEPVVPIFSLPTAEWHFEDKPRPLNEQLNMIKAAKASVDERTQGALPIGASRIGGLPDLPVAIEWPTVRGKKIPFVAQINLAEFAAKKKTLLPKKGYLYAFTLVSNDEQHHDEPVSLIYWDGDASQLARAERPADDEIWEDWGGERVYEIIPASPIAQQSKEGESDEESDRLIAYLGGEMEEYYGTPGEMADYRMLDGQDWISVLAVQSVGSMQWSDCGTLYFLMRRSALEKLDFSEVIPAVCSS